MILFHLPTDLYQKIIKDWVYPQILAELYRYHHTRRFKRVLNELVEWLDEQVDEYVVTNEGVFVLPEPGYFDMDRKYSIRIEPKDAIHLLRDYRFEIIPTKETQKQIDHFRRRQVYSGSLTPNLLEPIRKYYEIYGVARNRKLIFTFEQTDPTVIRVNNERRTYIHLPNGCIVSE
jgi:hypothetical protein